jgi:RNA-directed DNA polymerase
MIFCYNVGGVTSPLLANLYLHYAFDAWMQRHYVDVPFERYADDGVPRVLVAA